MTPSADLSDHEKEHCYWSLKKRPQTERFLFLFRSRSQINTVVDIDSNSICVGVHWDREGDLLKMPVVIRIRHLHDNARGSAPSCSLGSLTIIRMFGYLNVFLTVDFLPMEVISREEEHWKANAYQRSFYIPLVHAGRPALFDSLASSISFQDRNGFLHLICAVTSEDDIIVEWERERARTRDSSRNVLILLFEKRSTWTRTAPTISASNRLAFSDGADRHRSSSPSSLSLSLPAFVYWWLQCTLIMRIIEVKCNLARRRPMVGVSCTVKNNCSSSAFSFIETSVSDGNLRSSGRGRTMIERSNRSPRHNNKSFP